MTQPPTSSLKTWAPPRCVTQTDGTVGQGDVRTNPNDAVTSAGVGSRRGRGTHQPSLEHRNQHNPQAPVCAGISIPPHSPQPVPPRALHPATLGRESRRSQPKRGPCLSSPAVTPSSPSAPRPGDAAPSVGGSGLCEGRTLQQRHVHTPRLSPEELPPTKMGYFVWKRCQTARKGRSYTFLLPAHTREPSPQKKLLKRSRAVTAVRCTTQTPRAGSA